MVGKGVEVPGPLNFFPHKKRWIVLVGFLLFFLQTRSLCCSFCWVLPQQCFLRVPKGLLLCLLISGGHFHRRKQLFEEAFHFVTTYEQKEDSLPVLVFGTEQSLSICLTVK